MAQQLSQAELQVQLEEFSSEFGSAALEAIRAFISNPAVQEAIVNDVNKLINIPFVPESIEHELFEKALQVASTAMLALLDRLQAGEDPSLVAEIG